MVARWRAAELNLHCHKGHTCIARLPEDFGMHNLPTCLLLGFIFVVWVVVTVEVLVKCPEEDHGNHSFWDVEWG